VDVEIDFTSELCAGAAAFAEHYLTVAVGNYGKTQTFTLMSMSFNHGEADVAIPLHRGRHIRHMNHRHYSFCHNLAGVARNGSRMSFDLLLKVLTPALRKLF